MKIITIYLAAYLYATCIAAKPGGTYTLTGSEKNISDIIKADMAEYPELYKGVTLSAYSSQFKQENNIGKRKLSAGDQLRFPETLASIRAEKKAQADEEARIRNTKPRNTKIKDFQRGTIPNAMRHPESSYFSSLKRGEESMLIRISERLIDADFAKQLKITVVEENRAYALSFEYPSEPQLCYHALIIKHMKGAYAYYILTRTQEDRFQQGQISEIYSNFNEGVFRRRGFRKYDDLDRFIKEVTSLKRR